MRSLTKIAGVLVLIPFLSGWVAGSDDDDEDPSVTLEVTRAYVDYDEELDPVDVSVLLSSNKDVVGWEFAVCHDGDVVSIDEEDITHGDALEAFDLLFETITASEGRWTSAALVDAEIGVSDEIIPLEPGDDLELYVVSYTIEGPGTSDLDLCDLVSKETDPPYVDLIGDSVTPDTVSGVIIAGEPSDSYHFVAAEVFASLDSTVDVLITLDNDDPISGFQFGLTHDTDVVDIDELVEGIAIEDLNDGGGADFFAPDYDPVGGPGVTLGVIFTIGDTISELAAADEQEVVVARYEVSSDAELGESSSISFSSILGTQAIPVGIVGDDGFIMAKTSNGLITIASQFFRRGDPNGDDSINVADAIYLLQNLADAFSVPCTKAMDLNDSGNISIADALVLLCYLFCGTDVEPAEPFESCGPDLSPDSLPCDESAEVCLD